MIGHLKERLLDLVYPDNIYCISCERPIDNTFPYSLCPTCAKKISWANGTNCDKCGKTISDTDNMCQDCMDYQRGFDKAFTTTNYGVVERKLIHNFKFKDKSYLYKNLASLMAEKLKDEKIHFDYIVAVPMFKRKEKRRGYNQAELLAKEIAKITKIDHLEEALVRIKDTKALNSLDYYSRKATVENVFKTSEWVKTIIEKKDILLVDDILTTGSTASACSKVLKDAGADKIYVLSFASGVNKSVAPENEIAWVCD